MAELTSFTHPLPAWMDVLDRIEKGLCQSLEQAIEPAPLAQQPLPPATPFTSTFDERLAKMQARIDQTVLDTEDAGTLGGRVESVLAELRENMREAREKLVIWTKPAT